jgi:hypothetical protein
MRRRNSTGLIFCAIIFFCIGVLGLSGCGDDGPTPGSLTIATSSLPEGIINQPYSASVSGSGGSPPYTWSVSPALPANLSLDTTTGSIAGTPTKQATTTHTFTLSDTSTQTVQQTLSLTIDPPLSITSTSLPEASIGAAYNQPVQTVGGIGALTFSIVLPGTGTLPQNLSLNTTTGVISGTPIAPAGTFPFTVRVADTGGQQDTQALSIRVTPSRPPQITTTSLPGGAVGQAYNRTLQATGGIGTLAWSVSAGSLPGGLTLSSTGTILGTPAGTGTSNFTVRVTDSVGQPDTQPLSITVSPALTITTSSPLPNAQVGNPYSQTVQGSGGVPPFTWSVTPSLPAGLSLNATTGNINGTPAVGTQGFHSLTFTVQDSSATPQTANALLSLTVDPPSPPVIETTSPLPGGIVGQPYSQTLQATGGIGPLVWSVSGSLPANLSLSPDGTISGTPTIPGISTFTVTVTDALAQSASREFSISILIILGSRVSFPAELPASLPF